VKIHYNFNLKYFAQWTGYAYIYADLLLPLLGCTGHEYKPMHKGAKETGIVWYSFNLTSLKD